ncbi:MAG: ABC transporter permease, partial [Planctomycetaceae bacterium]|nr:ABC transporter permease [Planctomycetaceae bacterium]
MTNPVLHRELVTVLRRRGTVLVECGLVLGLVLLIALRWPTEPRIALSGSRSQQVFGLFAYGLLAAVLLLLPVFPATSIVRERKSGTLALLLNSSMPSWRIYSGKLLATLGLSGLMFALSLPAAAACYALGGISLGTVLTTYALLLLTAWWVAALGLLVSSFSAATDAAVRWTYGLVLFASVVLLLPYFLLAGAGGLIGEVSAWLRSASPIAAMMSLQGAGDVGGRGLIGTDGLVIRFATLAALTSATASIWTIARLNHRLFDRTRDSGVIADDQKLGTRVFRRTMFLVDPQRRSRHIGPLVNPVLAKEFRCRRFGRLHWLMRLVAVCAVISLALTILTTTQTVSWDVDSIGAIMVVLQVALLVLITPSLAAGLIATERESGGWVLLQSTPMSVWRIVWGKLLSVLVTVGLVLLATLPGYLVMTYIDPGKWPEVRRIGVCLLLTAAFVMIASAAAGSLYSRTVTAIAAAYAIVLAVCAGPLLIWLGRDA